MNKDKFLKKVVKFCIGFIVFYTLLQITLSYFVQVELSPTLTTCVYTFFGTELVSSTFIRIFKEKYEQKDNSNTTTTATEENNLDEISIPDVEITDNTTAQELIDKLNNL